MYLKHIQFISTIPEMSLFLFIWQKKSCPLNSCAYPDTWHMLSDVSFLSDFSEIAEAPKITTHPAAQYWPSVWVHVQLSTETFTFSMLKRHWLCSKNYAAYIGNNIYYITLNYIISFYYMCGIIITLPSNMSSFVQILKQFSFIHHESFDKSYTQFCYLLSGALTLALGSQKLPTSLEKNKLNLGSDKIPRISPILQLSYV